MQALEAGWGTEFANPLVDKRRAVDNGNATVAELQVFYLQKDPNSWVVRSSEVLDEVDRENRKLLEERRHSDELAETAMDPATRRLVRIELEDAMLADEIFSTLMGVKVVSTASCP